MSRRVPTVSIVMAAYNGIRYLPEQVHSILAQSYGDFEVIISDDCSEDDTFQYLLEIERSDKRIAVYRNENRMGYIRNFERCLKRASGRFIALCDQDDIWLPDKLQILVSEIDDKLLIHSDAEVVDDSGRLVFPSFTQLSRKCITDDSFSSLIQANIVTGCTCMFRRELADIAIPFSDVIPHDWWLALIAADKQSIGYCDKPLIKYRQHRGNAIGAIPAETEMRGVVQRSVERSQQLKRLAQCLRNRVKRKNWRFVNEIADYYLSYSFKFFRPRAFLFYLVNYNKFDLTHVDIEKKMRLLKTFFGLRLRELIRRVRR